MSGRRNDEGQATVELVALLPVVVVVAALLWQIAVVGETLWAATAAARAAARVHAVGGDADKTARRRLPAQLAAKARVRADEDGTVRVTVPIPAVLGRFDLGDTSARAHFAPQS